MIGMNDVPIETCTNKEENGFHIFNQSTQDDDN